MSRGTSIAAVALIVLGVVSWLVTRWRIDGSDCGSRPALLRRSSQRYPLSQVRRSTRCDLGWRGRSGSPSCGCAWAAPAGAARLAYLPVVQANALRARLLALSQGAHEATPEPTDRELVRSRRSRRRVAARSAARGRARRSYSLRSLVASAGSHGLVGVDAADPARRADRDLATVQRSFHATVAEAPEGLARSLAASSRRRPRRSRAAGCRRFTRRAAALAAVRLVPAGGRRRGRVRDGSDADEASGGCARSCRSVPRRGRASCWSCSSPGAPQPERRPPRRGRWKSPLRYRRLSVAFDERYAVRRRGEVARSPSGCR